MLHVFLLISLASGPHIVQIVDSDRIISATGHSIRIWDRNDKTAKLQPLHVIPCENDVGIMHQSADYLFSALCDSEWAHVSDCNKYVYALYLKYQQVTAW